MRLFRYFAVVILTALCLAACSSAKSVKYSSELTGQLRGWPASQLDEYRTYLLGSSNNPNAVVLDNSASGADFLSTGWTSVEGDAGHAVVRRALDAGLEVARLEDTSGILLGFLLAPDVETPSELRYFQLRTGRSGATPTYEILNPVFPNPSENLPY